MKRMTKQKKILHNALNSFKSFFNVEDLHAKIEPYNLGIATVYRFLKNLEENQEIHSYICNNRKIYSLHKQSHIHFTCEKCNQKKHLDVKNVDFLHHITEDEVCHFQIDVHGVCGKCKK